MKKSLSYYLILLVIRLKGLKKTFSGVPIDYKKLRKDDIVFPTNSFFKRKNRTNTFNVLKTRVTEIVPAQKSGRLLIYVHGGAFVSGPAQHHWDSLEKIARRTDYTIWMCDYPKAPEHQISEISTNMDELYRYANQRFNPSDITFMGDSVGATLLTALTQRLVKFNVSMPKKLILISPVMDSSFENPEIDQVEARDPMLSKSGVRSAKLMVAENGNLKDPLMSPLYGSFDGFPKTILFISENDITYPDQLLFITKLKASEVKYKIYLGGGMPHIWPLLPVMLEANMALNSIIELLEIDLKRNSSSEISSA